MVDITIFESEIGELLTFDVRIDGATPDLVATTAVLSLVVPGNPLSPFAMTNDAGVKGRAAYRVQAGDFPAGVYENCHVKYDLHGLILRTDNFNITSNQD